MKAEEYLRNSISKLFGKGASKLDLNTFRFSAGMAIKFAESYSESQNKHQIEKIEDLEEQLNDDGEMPVVNIPVKTTRYRLIKIVEGSDHSGENMTDKNQ